MLHKAFNILLFFCFINSVVFRQTDDKLGSSVSRRRTEAQFKFKMAAGGEEDGATCVTYKLNHFAEVQEVKTIIESIGSICHDCILLEAAAERLIGKSLVDGHVVKSPQN